MGGELTGRQKDEKKKKEKCGGNQERRPKSVLFLGGTEQQKRGNTFGKITKQGETGMTGLEKKEPKRKRQLSLV